MDVHGDLEGGNIVHVAPAGQFVAPLDPLVVPVGPVDIVLKEGEGKGVRKLLPRGGNDAHVVTIKVGVSEGEIKSARFI